MSLRKGRPVCGVLFLFAVMLAAGVPLRAQAPAAAQPSPSVLAKASDDALRWLRQLLTINTTNPPGNEAKAAEYIKEILAAEGIPSETLEVAPGRSAVVARLRSSALPDPARALLLLGHLDVVGVDKSKWSVDPFGAALKDGYIYGRGAIDDKGMVAANLAVFVALKRSGVRLERDVIFLASTDEEQGGDASIKTLIARYWDKFASGFAINEGGRVLARDGKVQYVGIQAREKVPYNVSVIAPGISERAEHAARVLSDMNPTRSAMWHDSIAPTMLEAGIRANVVPSEARANLNIRLLPGDLIDALVAELKKAVNDPQIRFEVQRDPGLNAPPSSIESDLYKSIERTSAQVFPDAVVVPYQSTGATDSAQLRFHNVQAYGLLPFPLVEEDERRMHADDERIPLDRKSTR